MTAQPLQTKDKSIDVELNQLTYSAYLLTLDPDLSRSVVMAALDSSIEDIASSHDLLYRTIEISLEQLRSDASHRSDRESSSIEASLYSGSGVARLTPALSLEEHASVNPILRLDSDARVAFVLHHVLGYTINEAAAMTQVSEKQFHAQLREAYRQLASLRPEDSAISGYILDQIAFA
jgi:predicted DNA-binding protein (UPF0251 family)